MNSAAALLQKLGDSRFIRYLLASIGATSIDFGAFLALMSLNMAAVPASAIGYSFGIVAHWLISSRAVFSDGVSAQRSARARQKALFVGSALIGLSITAGIVGMGENSGADPRIAKLVAMVASFSVVWMLRSKIIFRSGTAR